MRKLRTVEMQRLTLEEFKAAEKLPLVVVLDDVRSLYNVGSIFRTCDAFRVEALCLCGITATPPHPEIHKTALGGEDSVEWRYHATAKEAVEHYPIGDVAEWARRRGAEGLTTCGHGRKCGILPLAF